MTGWTVLGKGLKRARKELEKKVQPDGRAPAAGLLGKKAKTGLSHCLVLTLAGSRLSPALFLFLHDQFTFLCIVQKLKFWRTSVRICTTPHIRDAQHTAPVTKAQSDC